VRTSPFGPPDPDEPEPDDGEWHPQPGDGSPDFAERMERFRREMDEAFGPADPTLTISGSVDLKDKGAEIDFTKRF